MSDAKEVVLAYVFLCTGLKGGDKIPKILGKESSAITDIGSPQLVASLIEIHSLFFVGLNENDRGA